MKTTFLILAFIFSGSLYADTSGETFRLDVTNDFNVCDRNGSSWVCDSRWPDSETVSVQWVKKVVNGHLIRTAEYVSDVKPKGCGPMKTVYSFELVDGQINVQASFVIRDRVIATDTYDIDPAKNPYKFQTINSPTNRIGPIFHKTPYCPSEANFPENKNSGFLIRHYVGFYFDKLPTIVANASDFCRPTDAKLRISCKENVSYSEKPIYLRIYDRNYSKHKWIDFGHYAFDDRGHVSEETYFCDDTVNAGYIGDSEKYKLESDMLLLETVQPKNHKSQATLVEKNSNVLIGPVDMTCWWY